MRALAVINPVRRREGMSLIEIIFAFAIIGSMLTMAYAASLASWRNAVASNQRTQAQNLVQLAIETLRASREANNSWSSFAGDVSMTSPSAFHMQLQTVPGAVDVNDLACPSGETCKFVVQSGPLTTQVVGANAPAVDATPFTLSIRTVEVYFKGDATPSAPGSVNSSTKLNVASVTFLATVTWRDANGIDSNASASTILSETN